MGKVKIKKKSTLIDMTAMSDVTVLLLTFFMLTSTFLKKEPATVHTPSSVSEEAIPTSNLITVLVTGADQSGKTDDPLAAEGKIFISFSGDSIVTNETLRTMILEEAVKNYNTKHKNNPLTLTQKQVDAFAKGNMMGVPFKELPALLDMEPNARDSYLTEEAKKASVRVGIPINDNQDMDKLNEFQMWMKALKSVAQTGLNEQKDKLTARGIDPESDEGKKALRDAGLLYYALVGDGHAITIKADKDIPFESINRVFDNLQTMGLNKFTLMTALKSSEN